MAKINILDVLKQCFEKVIPADDGRTDISPLSFVVCLVYCYLGDAKTHSLEAKRRFLMKQVHTTISRSAFWERLTTRRLGRYLREVVAELMLRLSASVLVGRDLLKQLGVSGIRLVDSSSITLCDEARRNFPGTRTNAGIKWHLCFDVLSGTMAWFELTPSKVHDRKCFPPLATLAGRLVIFDLGYWDYGLLLAIENVEGFFLSRVKSNAVMTVKKVVLGLSGKYVGWDLFSVPLTRRRGSIIEVLIEKSYKGEMLSCRVLGFWNVHERCYHWYITNLTAPAHIIYPLYRLRWQIELVFKACKNSLNANQITSSEKPIIENLILASLVAHLSCHTILNIGLENLEEDEKLAISFQRVARVAVVLAQDFVTFLLSSSREHFFNLLQQIKLFSRELFDPNYKHRETALMRLNRMLAEGA